MQIESSLADALEIVRVTDVGLIRELNEDTVASDEAYGIVVLADGMGGYKAGEVASEMAVLSITAEVIEALDSCNQEEDITSSSGYFGEMQAEAQMLLNAVNNANARIFEVSQSVPECEGMGTTLVLGIFADNQLLVGHIGDSRLYRLRNQKLMQFTEDHSLLQEQINAGLITKEQAKFSANKNLVTRALGVDPTVELTLQAHDVAVGDIYLLCSDGLTDLVADEDIEAILNTSAESLDKTAQELVQLANENGGLDNISVILVRIKQSFERKVSGGNQFWLRGSGNSFFGWLK